MQCSNFHVSLAGKILFLLMIFRQLEENAQQNLIFNIISANLVASFGRALFSFGSGTFVTDEPLKYPKVNLTVKFQDEVQTAVNLDISKYSEQFLQWSEFVSAAATVVRIRQSVLRENRSWIRNHLKNGLKTIQDAGFVFGLGLLKVYSMNYFEIYDLLTDCDDVGRMALLLNISLTNMASADPIIMKILSLDIPSMVEKYGIMDSTFNEEKFSTWYASSSALLGLGYLFSQKCDSAVNQILLTEMLRKECHFQGKCFNTATFYSVTAALALGLVNLGHGQSGKWKEQNENMLSYLKLTILEKNQQKHHTRHLALQRLCSMLSLGLIFMKTQDPQIASLLLIPKSKFQQAYTSFLHISISILMYHMIHWTDIDQEDPLEWLCEQCRGCAINLEGELSVIIGLMTYISIKYYSTENLRLKKSLIGFYDMCLKKQDHLPPTGRLHLHQCLASILLSLSLVSAGTGDLDILKLLRKFKLTKTPELSYSTHVIMDLALGFLFQGNGLSVTGSSDLQIFNLLMTVLPMWPTSPDDTAYLLPCLKLLCVKNFDHSTQTENVQEGPTVPTQGVKLTLPEIALAASEDYNSLLDIFCQFSK